MLETYFAAPKTLARLRAGPSVIAHPSCCAGRPRNLHRLGHSQ